MNHIQKMIILIHSNISNINNEEIVERDDLMSTSEVSKDLNSENQELNGNKNILENGTIK